MQNLQGQFEIDQNFILTAIAFLLWLLFCFSDGTKLQEISSVFHSFNHPHCTKNEVFQ